MESMVQITMQKRNGKRPPSVISVSLAIFHSYVKLPEGEQISVWKSTVFAMNIGVVGQKETEFSKIQDLSLQNTLNGMATTLGWK